ncbi:MAG: DsbA family protein [Gammaproteobacteria bacterium]|nr:DsbA family protein [Gammaproteobacteria bacterium]
MTEVEPYPFERPLTVCIDIKNPHAYLAKDLIYQLEDDLGLQADWLPYLVPSMSAPSAPEASDDRGTRHRRHRARYVERDIQRYAALRGLVIRDIHRQVDSSVAALGLLHVRDADPAHRRRFIDAMFSGYWEGRLDIEDPAAMAELLGEAGADAWADLGAGLAAGRLELEALQARLAVAGIFNVPALVVGDVVDGVNEPEIFYGRAHLPMIRWLLQGQLGPPPI